MIKFTSTFHGVGQGLFYTLNINNKTIVYDCGSDSKLAASREKIIDTYINKSLVDNYFKEKKIDLFIISHFHRDHINGIDRLKKVGIDIKEFVMPYYCKEIRWLFWEDGDENILEFINDPVSYLQGLYPKSIFSFIKNSDNLPESENEDVENDFTGWRGASIEKDEWQNNLNVTFRSSLGSYRIPYWKFKFLQDSFPEKTEIINIKNEIIAANIDIIKDPSKINDIIKIMQKYIPSCARNETSLICCHGPVLGQNFKHIHFELNVSINGQICNNRYCFCEHIADKVNLMVPIFHLLSGDAEIENRLRFEDAFINELNKVLVFQIPHHGSKENWHNWFLYAHSNVKYWIFSRGNPNRHHHPTATFPTSINKIDLTENGKFELIGTLN
jgi:hypothetical protein